MCHMFFSTMLSSAQPPPKPGPSPEKLAFQITFLTLLKVLSPRSRDLCTRNRIAQHPPSILHRAPQCMASTWKFGTVILWNIVECRMEPVPQAMLCPCRLGTDRVGQVSTCLSDCVTRASQPGLHFVFFYKTHTQKKEQALWINFAAAKGLGDILPSQLRSSWGRYREQETLKWLVLLKK